MALWCLLCITLARIPKYNVQSRSRGKKSFGWALWWWDLTLLSFSERIWPLPTIFLTPCHPDDDHEDDHKNEDDHEDEDDHEQFQLQAQEVPKSKAPGAHLKNLATKDTLGNRKV